VVYTGGQAYTESKSGSDSDSQCRFINVYDDNPPRPPSTNVYKRIKKSETVDEYFQPKKKKTRTQYPCFPKKALKTSH